MATRSLFLLVACLVAVLSTGITAQAPPQAADLTIDAAMRSEVIDRALQLLVDGYVFPDVAKQMEHAVRARQQRKEYDAITSARQLAQTLTDHLRAVSKDGHLGVNFSPKVLPPEPPLPTPAVRPGPEDQARLERQAAIAARQNFGFMKVERLAGNIGYVDFRAFMPPALAADTAAAAMTFLAGTDAVIFDLRQNGGGDPAMVAFLTSYLFGPQPVHLNDFYNRITGDTRQSWTLAYVPGKRLTNKDVYILTSSRTFSGAEEFTYNLKHLKRATVVGETTGGGAHLVGGRRINDHFMIGVPSGRPINAVTKGDWEGVGVEPDVKVAADDALKTAHVMALEKQQQTLAPDAQGLRNEVAGTIQSLKNELAATASAARPAPLPAGSATDDFESGTLTNWTVDRSGSGGWFIYTDGKTPPNPAQTDPNVPFNVPNPPQGKYAVVTDMNGPGRRILYRDVTLDGPYRLQLTLFWVNGAQAFSDLDAVNRDTIADHQQVRIDLVSPSAPVTSIAKTDLLATVFRTRPGDPARREPTPIIFDLSQWQGQTVRLRITVADNSGPLRAGLDNLRFESLRK